MSPVRLLDLVSGQGRLMQAMIRATELGVMDFEVARVVADRSCPALQKADALGVPAENLDYDSLSERFDYDEIHSPNTTPQTGRGGAVRVASARSKTS